MLKIKKLIADNKGFVLFMFGMLVFRTAIADWYAVPSSSMYPNVMIGDRIVANRLAYDIKLPFTDVIVKHVADPQRGDIVTFTSPKDGIRLIKRLVALPGDVVEMRGEQLIINGVTAAYGAPDASVTPHLSPDYEGKQIVMNEQILGRKNSILVMPGRPAMRNFGPVTVPQGEYLMLGDNRDNSADSRYIGFIKRELITGQVKRVAFSLDYDKYFLPRIERFGAAL